MWWFPILHSGEYGTGHHIGFQRFIIDLYSTDLTTVLSHLFYKESLREGLLYGSLVALVGVGLVVFNGSVLLKVNPLGDFLTLVAATMWAFYCLILKRLSRSYPTLFITRKVFFYGILSLFFYFAIYPLNIKLELLKLPVVYLNILFLGVIASMLCYIMWNTAVRALGASKTANYIYIVPLVTLITSAIFLSETITLASGIGALAIIRAHPINQGENSLIL